MLWGGWGEKKESTWETVVPRALSIFSIIAIFVGIPSRSLCTGESGGGVPPCSPNPDPISDQKM